MADTEQEIASKKSRIYSLVGTFVTKHDLAVLQLWLAVNARPKVGLAVWLAVNARPKLDLAVWLKVDT